MNDCSDCQSYIGCDISWAMHGHGCVNLIQRKDKDKPEGNGEVTVYKNGKCYPYYHE